jgi:phosphatidylserine/phosphatidylglycerophosphate/cardiolipin synthase-like enzyme
MIQPADGAGAIIKAIEKARKSVEIVIFRFDEAEIERALIAAVDRGVSVDALIAFTNRGGEKILRKLEMRFLSHGITVARTADDLVRYHGKMMIVDRKELFVLGFNFTHLDIDHSRSFGVITRNPTLVKEAVKLFECDTKRRPFAPQCSRFLVSPLNARKQLLHFIAGAKKELCIYDLKISDRQVLRALKERRESGVNIRIIGNMNSADYERRELSKLRLHARVIIRDGSQAFLGSQSLRQLELDSRREIGIILRDRKIVAEMLRIFEEDWKSGKVKKGAVAAPLKKHAKTAAKKLARAVTKNLPVKSVVKEVVREAIDPEIVDGKLVEHLEDAVKDAVKEAVHESVSGVVHKVLSADDSAGGSRDDAA